MVLLKQLFASPCASQFLLCSHLHPIKFTIKVLCWLCCYACRASASAMYVALAWPRHRLCCWNCVSLRWTIHPSATNCPLVLASHALGTHASGHTHLFSDGFGPSNTTPFRLFGDIWWTKLLSFASRVIVLIVCKQRRTGKLVLGLGFCLPLPNVSGTPSVTRIICFVVVYFHSTFV